jgi:phage replication O-like protein O
MADPQVEDGFVRLANDIHEQIMVSYFTERQIRILEFIIRLSYGCQKKEAYIPRQSDFELVGVGAGHIRAQLDLLIRDNVVFQNGDYYSINKDYDHWRVSRAKAYSVERLKDLVRKNLPNK